MSYSIVEGGFTGTGNLSSDPQFMNVGAGDFRLTANSPAIDAADRSALTADAPYDRGLAPRSADAPAVPDTGNGAAPVVDMGAFEFFTTSGARLRNRDPPMPWRGPLCHLSSSIGSSESWSANQGSYSVLSAFSVLAAALLGLQQLPWCLPVGPGSGTLAREIGGHAGTATNTA